MKTAVVTGATSGIGLAVANTLCRQGYSVLGIGRSKEKCDAAIRKIKERTAKADIRYYCADLAQQTEVNRAAGKITEVLNENYDGKLDTLINNAGGVRNWYTTTNEGYEMQFALNHLAGFLLTYRLLPHIKKAQGKMILTGSDSHKYMRIRWNDIMFKKHYSCLYAYKQTKLCNLLFAKEFNRRLHGTGVRAYVVDPGLVNTDIGSKGTTGLVSWFWNMRQKHGVAPIVSAQTYAFILNESDLKGLYYKDCRQKEFHRNVEGEDEVKLWEFSEKLCGIDYEEVL